MRRRSSGAGGRGGPEEPSLSRFELVTRDGCHLCDEMAAALDAVLPRHGLVWTALDVDGDDDLRQRFGEVVPVLLRDGRPVAKVRIDERRLERLVRRRR